MGPAEELAPEQYEMPEVETRAGRSAVKAVV